MRDEITDLPGVTLADVFGPRDEEVHIEIGEQTLRKYGLTLGQVAKLVQSASLDLPAGSVKTKGGEILVRTKGRRYYAAADYHDVAILTRPDGTVLTPGPDRQPARRIRRHRPLGPLQRQAGRGDPDIAGG